MSVKVMLMLNIIWFHMWFRIDIFFIFPMTVLDDNVFIVVLFLFKRKCF